MGVVALALRELANNVAGGIRADQFPLGGHETLNTDGATSVDTASANADLGAKTEAVAISETSAGVVEDAGRVDGAEEVVGGGLVLGDDACERRQRKRGRIVRNGRIIELQSNSTA